MTNLVQFPGLGLSFELDRVAFSIGGADIYWYGVCIAFGLCLALVFAFRRCTEFGIDADSMVDVILIGVVLGIASARLYYVAMAPYNYDTIWDVLAVRDGGLAIYGGIIGAVLGAWFLTQIDSVLVLLRIPAWWNDFIAGMVLLAVLVFDGRLRCALERNLRRQKYARFMMPPPSVKPASSGKKREAA